MDKITGAVVDVLNVVRGKGSWKTGAAGIVTGIASVLTLLVVPLIDNDPNTVVNWGGLVTAVVTSIGLYFARDDDKTSEDVGNK